jgi:hypothetical protein
MGMDFFRLSIFGWINIQYPFTVRENSGVHKGYRVYRVLTHPRRFPRPPQRPVPMFRPPRRRIKRGGFSEDPKSAVAGQYREVTKRHRKMG